MILNEHANTCLFSVLTLVCVMTNVWRHTTHALVDPGGGGARPARAPPNGRGPMIFFCPKRYFFSIFPRSLRLRIVLSLILIEMWSKRHQKHAKNDFYCYTSTFNTFNDFLPPTPVDKVHAPPKVKSWIRHWHARDSAYKCTFYLFHH